MARPSVDDIRILPIPDSHTCPGGLLMEVLAKGIRCACADPQLADWLAKRHDNLWPGGWKTDDWSRYIGAEECLQVAPATIRDAIEEMPADQQRRAAISYERVVIAEKSTRLAA